MVNYFYIKDILIKFQELKNYRKGMELKFQAHLQFELAFLLYLQLSSWTLDWLMKSFLDVLAHKTINKRLALNPLMCIQQHML